MPSDPRDYRVSISGLSETSPRAGMSGNGPAQPFLCVLFNCCRAYVRVYRSPDASHYHARCPKCGKSVRFQVGDGGTDERSFVVE
jgi:hypothetical protein